MTISGDRPTVLFSIEIAARELDSKLVMASALAARGLRSIVGHKEMITGIGRNSKRVVWQGKGLFSDRSPNHFADELIANESATMFVQDEGAIHQVNAWTENVLQKHYVDQIRKRNITRVCMWGERQRQVFASHARETEGFVGVTGSPRFDLCLEDYAWITEDTVAKLAEKHAPYILICTRFTAVAHAEGMHDPFKRKLNPKIWPESFDMKNVTDLWFSKWHRDVQDFADMVVMIKEVANNYPKHTIILRPHPSESMAFYKQAFSSFPNVVVTREGNVLCWIRAADLVIHSNCTTGIESVMAGRPTLNMLPASDNREETDIEVAREAGLSAQSVPDALEKADLLLSGRAPAHVWSPHAQSMLNNLKAPSVPMMADETLRVLADKGITGSALRMPRRRNLREFARRIVKGPATTAYVASKRGPFSKAHVERIIHGCRTRGLGKGRISEFAPTYIVVEPA